MYQLYYATIKDRAVCPKSKSTLSTVDRRVLG